MNQNSFCSFRWVDSLINLESCEVRSCCKTPAQKISLSEIEQSGANVFDNSAYIKERRLEMLQGHRHSDCSYCWNLEQKNIFHTRKRSASMEDFVGEYGFSLQELAKSPPSATTLSRLTEVHKSENLEILLKNTCQMKCHYCNADFSSAWEKENLSQGLQKKQNKPDVELRQQFHQAFWQYLPSKLAKIKELSIIGGEPLLQKEFYDLLDKISEFKSDLNSQRLRILVISNLSVSDATMERFLSKVESLRDSVDFYLLPSIDSTGARAEYVRTGLDWNLFQRNLDRAFSSELFSKIRFIVTMSAFNVSDLSNLLQFFYDKAQRHPQQKIELIPNIVAQPEKMSPLILDASFAPYLKEALLFLSQHPISSAQDQKIFYDFIENLYQTLQTQDQNSLLLQQEQFRQWIQKYDGLRSTDFLHTHPEFKLFFKGPDDPVVRV